MKADDKEPPFPDIGFGEALRRFIQADPQELPSSIGVAGKAAERAKARAGPANAEVDPAVARAHDAQVGERAKRAALGKMPPKARRKAET